MTKIDEQFDAYMSSGSARGARNVLDEARRRSAEPTSAARGGSASWKVAALLPAVVIVVLVAVAALSNRDEARTVDVAGPGQAAPATTVAPAESVPPQTIPEDKLDPTLKAQIEAGWVPMSDRAIPLGDGTVVPTEAWIPFDEDPMKVLDDQGRTPVYDRPNGVVIGYLFDVGYAPKDVANSPNFDIDAIRREFGVCAQGDFECQEQQIRERVQTVGDQPTAAP